MKKFPLIGLFLLFPTVLNYGITKTNETSQNGMDPRIQTELMVKNVCQLRSNFHRQSYKDLLLYKTKILTKFTQEDFNKVSKICKDLDIDELHLYRVFYTECSGNSQAVNDSSDATGLIGFLPSTAKNLGTTVKDIQRMKVSEQLDYVYAYYKPICEKYKLKSYTDVYLAVFHPRALGKGLLYVVADKNSKRYRWNHWMDKNKDSTLTVKEIVKTHKLV